MSDTQQGPGWWQASDGKWYPPQRYEGQPPPIPLRPCPKCHAAIPTGVTRCAHCGGALGFDIGRFFFLLIIAVIVLTVLGSVVVIRT